MSTRKSLPAIAAVVCAFAIVGPIAGASAATPASAETNAFQVGQTAATNAFQVGAAAAASGFQAGADALAPLIGPGLFGDGLFPGFVNLGPTGPLGPLGSHGPLGANGQLPTGLDAFNLGPTGPLGPGGQLG